MIQFHMTTPEYPGKSLIFPPHPQNHEDRMISRQVESQTQNGFAEKSILVIFVSEQSVSPLVRARTLMAVG